jgi:hypothetical protein
MWFGLSTVKGSSSTIHAPQVFSTLFHSVVAHMTFCCLFLYLSGWLRYALLEQSASLLLLGIHQQLHWPGLCSIFGRSTVCLLVFIVVFSESVCKSCDIIPKVHECFCNSHFQLVIYFCVSTVFRPCKWCVVIARNKARKLLMMDIVLITSALRKLKCTVTSETFGVAQLIEKILLWVHYLDPFPLSASAQRFCPWPRSFDLYTEVVSIIFLHEHLLIPRRISELVDEFVLLFDDCVFSTFTSGGWLRMRHAATTREHLMCLPQNTRNFECIEWLKRTKT